MLRARSKRRKNQPGGPIRRRFFFARSCLSGSLHAKHLLDRLRTGLFQHPCRGYPAKTAFAVFRTKTQSHEEESLGPTGPFPHPRRGWSHGRRGKPLRGRPDLFVALCLCAKLKKRSTEGQIRPWTLEDRKRTRLNSNH